MPGWVATYSYRPGGIRQPVAGGQPHVCEVNQCRGHRAGKWWVRLRIRSQKKSPPKLEVLSDAEETPILPQHRQNIKDT